MLVPELLFFERAGGRHTRARHRTYECLRYEQGCHILLAGTGRFLLLQAASRIQGIVWWFGCIVTLVLVLLLRYYEYMSLMMGSAQTNSKYNGGAAAAVASTTLPRNVHCTSQYCPVSASNLVHTCSRTLSESPSMAINTYIPVPAWYQPGTYEIVVEQAHRAELPEAPAPVQSRAVQCTSVQQAHNAHLTIDSRYEERKGRGLGAEREREMPYEMLCCTWYI